MNRLSFLRMGALDDGMTDTGGENLELSWRLWMCGGAVATAVCSRVGHMFKPPSRCAKLIMSSIK
jgi:polypeptide N-acetylgalactosaminyltransferase